MLSILIPTYNYDCSKLARDLHKQALDLNIDFEILVYDDYSSKKYNNNKDLNNLCGVTYKELERNYGRAAIRNLMAKDAKYNYLLFLDCDGDIPSPNFLSLYMNSKDDASVISGGRIYPPKEKIKDCHFLHWKYGVKRESSCNKMDAKNFMTNNFLIQKKIFNDIVFDESIEGYGHEDTLFGIELKKKGYKFKIIKNPVIHMGLYSAEDFLKNTRNSVKNLSEITDIKFKINDFFDIKLIKAYYKISKLKLDSFACLYYKLFCKSIEKNLKSKNPNLCLLDSYKLGYYFTVKKNG